MSSSNTSSSTTDAARSPTSTPPPSSPGFVTSTPLNVIGEFVCDLQVFLNIRQMSAYLVHSFCFNFFLFFSSRKLECKICNCISFWSEYHVPGCELVKLSSATPTQNQNTWDWVLPVEGLVKCNGSLFSLLNVLTFHKAVSEF